MRKAVRVRVTEEVFQILKDIVDNAQPEALGPLRDFVKGIDDDFNDNEGGPSAGDLIWLASRQYKNDDCEIDDDAQISRADDGAWVNAWVWVQYPHQDDD